MNASTGGLIKSIGEIGIERLRECSDHAGNKFIPAVRACFQAKENGRAEAMGTCFFLEIQDRRFIVTAAHVIDKNEFGKAIYVAAGTRLMPLEATFFTTVPIEGKRGSDRFDFAFAELNDKKCADLDAEFILESWVSANQVPESKRGFMALGYPVSRQKVEYNKPYIRSNPCAFVGFSKAKPALESILGINGDHHFFIDRAEYLMDFNGNKVNPIKMFGYSGGILIDLGTVGPENLASSSESVALLAGVVIEYHQNHQAIVAVKIQIIIEKIREMLGLYS